LRGFISLNEGLESIGGIQEERRKMYQAGEEVEDNVEHYRRHKFDRYVCDYTPQGFCKGMHKSIRSLLLNDRSLIIERVDLSNADKSVHSGGIVRNGTFLSWVLWTYKTEKNRAAPLLWKPADAFGVLKVI
jgi:hypothetical protein